MREKKTILYVDDDADDREMLADAIGEANADVDVLFAENGLDALAFLQRRSELHETLPSLIVLDLNMPFADGKEIFSRLRREENYKDLPVIIFSSSEKPQDKEMFNNLGIEYFTKPSSLGYLSEVVGRMLQVCC